MFCVREVHAGYGATPILFGVSLEVRQGEAVALLGKNGMGKTTLMKTAIGFLKPWRGTIEFEGRHAAIEPRQPQRRRAVPLAQLADAGALERIERRPVRAMMTALLAGPPHGQRPHQAAHERHRQDPAQDVLASTDAEQRARRPALHRPPGQTPNFSRVTGLSRSSRAEASKTITPFSMM